MSSIKCVKFILQNGEIDVSPEMAYLFKTYCDLKEMSENGLLSISFELLTVETFQRVIEFAEHRLAHPKEIIPEPTQENMKNWYNIPTWAREEFGAGCTNEDWVELVAAGNYLSYPDLIHVAAKRLGMLIAKMELSDTKKLLQIPE